LGLHLLHYLSQSATKFVFATDCKSLLGQQFLKKTQASLQWLLGMAEVTTKIFLP
jgi:hypothetical protein